MEARGPARSARWSGTEKALFPASRHKGSFVGACFTPAEVPQPARGGSCWRYAGAGAATDRGVLFARCLPVLLRAGSCWGWSRAPEAVPAKTGPKSSPQTPGDRPGLKHSLYPPLAFRHLPGLPSPASSVWFSLPFFFLFFNPPRLADSPAVPFPNSILMLSPLALGLEGEPGWKNSLSSNYREMGLVGRRKSTQEGRALFPMKLFALHIFLSSSSVDKY